MARCVGPLLSTAQSLRTHITSMTASAFPPPPISHTTRRVDHRGRWCAHGIRRARGRCGLGEWNGRRVRNRNHWVATPPTLRRTWTHHLDVQPNTNTPSTTQATTRVPYPPQVRWVNFRIDQYTLAKGEKATQLKIIDTIRAFLEVCLSNDAFPLIPRGRDIVNTDTMNNYEQPLLTTGPSQEILALHSTRMLDGYDTAGRNTAERLVRTGFARVSSPSSSPTRRMASLRTHHQPHCRRSLHRCDHHHSRAARIDTQHPNPQTPSDGHACIRGSGVHGGSSDQGGQVRNWQCQLIMMRY